MGISEKLGLSKGQRYVFFGGKGGVGKTTCAAATAVWLSEEEGKEVLVVSTDPAHSLSDIFEQDIGSEPTPIEGVEGLKAIEIDPEKAAEEYVEVMKRVYEMSKDKGMEDLFGGEDLLKEQEELLKSSPGIDEAAAFQKFMELMKDDSYDVIVFDTAPTGHTLRFLSVPETLERQVKTMIKVRRTLRQVSKMLKTLIPFADSDEDEEDEILENLEKMKKEVEEIRETLSDASLTAFRLVMTPEEMAIYEARRALRTLNHYEIPVDMVIVNKVMPKRADECEFCRTRRKMEEKRLELVEKYFGDKEILQIPMFAEEVRGLEKIRQVAEILYGEPA
ncbi:ArsA family ATPase [Methanopyrus kandleri]